MTSCSLSSLLHVLSFQPHDTRLGSRLLNTRERWTHWSKLRYQCVKLAIRNVHISDPSHVEIQRANYSLRRSSFRRSSSPWPTPLSGKTLDGNCRPAYTVSAQAVDSRPSNIAQGLHNDSCALDQLGLRGCLYLTHIVSQRWLDGTYLGCCSFMALPVLGGLLLFLRAANPGRQFVTRIRKRSRVMLNVRE